MKKTSDVKVSFRVEKSLKEAADCLFRQLGLNMTTAINIFLRQAVRESRMPFELNSQKQPFINQYTSEDIETLFQRAVEDEIAKKLSHGDPVVSYDGERKEVYLQYPDGKKEYVKGEEF